MVLEELRKERVLKTILTVLRIIVGWHLLYEGISKLAMNEWSSYEYLMNSHGIFSSFFILLASNDPLLSVVDFLNIWLLTVGGILLILGYFNRITALITGWLLLFYYLAYIPIGTGRLTGNFEGNNLLINKTLIESLVLFSFAFLHKSKHYSLDRFSWIKQYFAEKKDSSEIPVKIEEKIKRRELIKNLISLPILGTFGILAAKDEKLTAIDSTSSSTIRIDRKSVKDLEGDLPRGKLLNLEISRLIMGSNLIGGYSHSRDLGYVSHLFKAYNSESKIMETYALAEQAGINATFMTTSHSPYIVKYKQIAKSKFKIINQCYIKEDDLFKDINTAIDYGADALYVQGHYGDIYVRDGKTEILAKVIEYMKSQGKPAGIGAHSIEVIKACEEFGVNPDFYVKTFHHDNYWSAHPRENRVEFSVDMERFSDHNKFHDNIFDLFPEKTVEVMSKVEKPFIGFKVLAAGAIKPENGFKYAFENGADFICVGMFDFQIIDNVNIAQRILTSDLIRNRPWYS